MWENAPTFECNFLFSNIHTLRLVHRHIVRLLLGSRLHDSDIHETRNKTFSEICNNDLGGCMTSIHSYTARTFIALHCRA